MMGLLCCHDSCGVAGLNGLHAPVNVVQVACDGAHNGVGDSGKVHLRLHTMK